MSILIYTKIQKINDFRSDTANYFKVLSNIANRPKRLFYMGTIPKERRPTVAIVGTRKPSTYGKEITRRLAYDLASRGVVIVSGLALGIDGIAHQAALEASGTTLAVMPSGLDRIHPATHRYLAYDIIKNGGALITEYETGTETYPLNFIARNRLVSGISDGIIVVEASAQSGTMHTARFALDQGKSVMAVPGNITSPASEGCHNLLKAGARLITSVSDVIDELGLTDHQKQAQLPLASNPEEQSILKLLQSGLRDGEELQLKSSLEPAQFAKAMTMLELTGKIQPLGGNRWGLC